MQMLKTIAVITTVMTMSLQAASADDSVWRSTRPLRIRVADKTVQTASPAAQSVWDRVEYPLLVRKLQSDIEHARENVEFWELRLENYDRLRFTDATQTAIKHAEISLQASRRHVADATQKLSLVRRYRVVLGQLRAQMLQQGSARSQLGR